MSKRDHHMPGWVSRGNVHVNVGRDLHIHGGRGSVVEPSCVCEPSRDYVSGLAFGTSRACAVLWTLVCVAARLLGALLVLAAWLTFTTLSAGFWVLCRAVDVLHRTVRRVESAAGGAPTQLVYVPSILQPRDHSAPMLGPGARVNELADNATETEYVDSN